MTVPFRGKHVDPISLWSDYVEFPQNWNPGNDEFSPLVVCPNPDHHTEKRHFQVNLTKPLVHCFAGCGISGTYEDAIVMIEGVTHRQARKSILRHASVMVSGVRRKKAGRRVHDPVAHEVLEYNRFLPQVALDYLGRRGISDEIISRFEIGWDSDALRVVIPVKDARGRTRLLIKRTVKPHTQPKYLYTEGVPRNGLLFGLDTIDLGTVRSEGIVLVEGSIDKLVLYANGIPNVVAILGSKVSEIQAMLISNLRPKIIYTMFDADGSGIEATKSTALRIRGIPIRVCRYPRGKTDPAELNREEAHRILKRAIPFQQFRRSAKISMPERRTRKEYVG